MANQFASEFVELFKALTGIETLSGVAVASYIFASVLTFLGTRRGALQAYVNARPRLAKVVRFLEIFAVSWSSSKSEARGADSDPQ